MNPIQAEVMAQYMEALVEATTIAQIDRIMAQASQDSDIENRVYRALIRLSKALIDKQEFLAEKSSNSP